MSLPSAQNRKPYERAAYATLKVGDDGGEEGQPSSPVATTPVAESAASEYFALEAGKLEQLRAALWQAFQSSPAISLPAPLIDLTIAYTNALRLELSLLGCSKPSSTHSTGIRVLPVCVPNRKWQ